MNKIIILSLALLTGISHNSYAKIPAHHLIMLASATVSCTRFAWYVKKSPHKNPADKTLDAFNRLLIEPNFYKTLDDLKQLDISLCINHIVLI